MYFWTYGLRKTWLYKCIKSPVSEDHSTSNMLNGGKQCWNLNHSTFTIFIDPCEDNSSFKSLSEWYAKSLGCLLTHSVLIISILFLTEAIYCNVFSSDYLRNKNYFLIFSTFSKLRFNFQRFQNEDDPHSWCIFELTDSQKRG